MFLAVLIEHDQLSSTRDSDTELPVPPPLVIVTSIPAEETAIVPKLKLVSPMAAEVVGAAPLTAR
ncbi:hypothetical protein KIV40_27900, partial [Vibrio sp. D173a]|uniref:hypothetical protein n=1 Tax=Vibrio sp. D173a TaxID=2836349 RepID=UPI00255648A9